MVNALFFNNPLVHNFITILFIVSGLLSFPLGYVTAKYYDRLLKEHNLPYPPIIIDFSPFAILRRANTYLVYILFNGPKITKPGKYRDQYRNQIGDFSFRKNARFIDYIFVVCFLVSLISLALLVLFGALSKH